jgi:hypothetical protein
MIESLFHRLKNRYLYTRKLDSLETLRKYVGEYIEDANHRIPLGPLGGATPFEAFTGKFQIAQIEKIEYLSALARVTRIEKNRNSHCLVCPS